MAFLSDNFSTVANGADLTTDAAVAWTKGAGSGLSGALVADASSRLYVSSTQQAWYTAEANLPAAADYTVSGTFVWLSQVGQLGVGARMDAGGAGQGNGYLARYRAFHGFELCKVAAGTATALGVISASDPTVAGSTVTLSIQVSGTSITGTVSGAVSGTVTVTDSTYAAAGYAGLIGAAVEAATTGLHCTSITGTNAATATAGPLPNLVVSFADPYPDDLE